MSTHLEWIDTAHPFFAVTYVPAGHDVTTGEPADEETSEETLAERGALVVSADDAAIIAGTPDELRALLTRALAALDAATVPPLPELPDGATACPHVYTADEVAEMRRRDEEEGARWFAMHGAESNFQPRTLPEVGSVCGAELNLWDKEPVRRDLEWDNGWIAGPSKYADGGGGDEEVACDNLHTWALPEIADWQ